MRSDAGSAHPARSDLKSLAGELERLLRLRSFPIGMKLIKGRPEMEAIERVRRPTATQTLDQIVGQAARLGRTVGVRAEDLAGDQCRAVVGLGNAKSPKWASGADMAGVWYATQGDAALHRASMHCVADGRYGARCVSPLASGRLVEPDIALFYELPILTAYAAKH